ncbi:MAG: hydroxyacylglutathione hydrolase [Citromicrobium sp.]|nr:MAG: hydroxyacylglutathione hydrolase [Citromicrobium sp.]
MIEVHLSPCLSDNYGLLAHDPASGETAAIDTPDAAAILAAAEAKGWRISQIWNTHWHPDHAGGNAAIRAATGCTVTAPAEVTERFGPVDRVVAHGERVMLGAHEAEVIDVGGHTLGHIAYHLPQAQIAFVGDALFALGCGRMFEGTPAQFWASLLRLRALPEGTALYCAHEYTAANATFARHADPDNAALAAYAEEVAARRAAGQPTVPTTLAREAATNPFLRADAPALMARWGDGSGDPVQTFAALRAAKDSF